MRQLITITLLSVATVQADDTTLDIMPLDEARQILAERDKRVKGQVGIPQLIVTLRVIKEASIVVKRSKAQVSGSNSPGSTR